MKKNLILIFLIANTLFGFAQKRVIENPPVDFTTTGITYITRVEMNNELTRVHIHSKFIPNWWVKFDKSTFLEDETGKKYLIQSMEGGQMDQEIFMPASGDSTFVLIFPRLDNNVKKVNYGEGDKIQIYGIALDKVKNKNNNKNAGAVPKDLMGWIQEEIGEYKESGIKPFDAPDFLSHGKARIVGFINGYDRRAGFTSGMIHTNNNITNESLPVAFDIAENGWFAVEIPLVHPQEISLGFGNVYVPVYVEQGSKLGLVLDWEDFLLGDRYRDRTYTFWKNQYVGSLARINRELRLSEPRRIRYGNYSKVMKENNPDEITVVFRNLFDENMAKLNQLKAEGSISEDAFQILSYAEYDSFGTSLLDYSMNNEYARRENPDVPPILPGFYTFLKDIPLNSPGLLTTGNWVLINRFEFLSIFRMPMSAYMPEKSYFDFLEDDLLINLTEEEKQIIDTYDSYRGKHINPEDSTFRQASEAIDVVNKKYSDYQEDYDARYIEPYHKRMERIREIELQYMDSIYYQVLGLEPSLFYEMAKVRSLPFRLKNATRSDAIRQTRLVSDAITHPFLKDEVWRMFENSLPAEDGGMPGYVLKPGKGTNIFKGILDQFKGNLVMVDFWATTCGPCIHTIKNTKEQRQKHENEGKLTYVFITDERGSPQSAYDKFVDEQELTNTFRVTKDEWNHLQQLFQFSGIPRYVLIDKEGRVLDDNFSYYSINDEILEKYK